MSFNLIVNRYRATLLTVTALAFSIGGPAKITATEKTCLPFDKEAQRRVSVYVSKLIRAAPNSKLTIATADLHTDTCFRKLEFVINDRNEIFTLFLSPDQRFVIPQIYDLTIDPVVKEAKETKEREVKLNRYVRTHMRPSIGEPNAAVTLVMFVDLQCPYSRKAVETLQSTIIPTMPDLRVVLLQYPLKMHNWAFTGSLLSTCVVQQKQSRAWPITGTILANQDRISKASNETDVLNQMMSLDLPSIDKAQLASCVNQHATEQDIAEDVDIGSSMGVQLTPTTFVNGIKVAGLFTADTIIGLIRSVSGGKHS